MKGKEGIRIERRKFIAGIFIGVFMSLLDYGQDQPQPGPAPGTGKIVVEVDPDIPNSFIVRLPEGFALVGEEGGQARMIAGPIEATITCTCTDQLQTPQERAKGCFPYTSPHGDGCVSFNCNECKKTSSVTYLGREIVLNQPTILNLKAGVRIVERIEDIPLQPVNPIMLQLDTVINSIKKLYEGTEWIPDSVLAQWREQDTLTYTHVVVDVFGKWAVIPFPIDLLEHPYVALKAVGPDGGCTCSCRRGTGCRGNCSKIRIPGIGPIRYCFGPNCMTCTMNERSLTVVNPKDNTPKIEIKQIQEIAPDQYQITVKITSNVFGHAVLTVSSVDLSSFNIQTLYSENIVFTPHSPVVEKTFNITVNSNASYVALNISDGIGRIYSNKLLSLP